MDRGRRRWKLVALGVAEVEEWVVLIGVWRAKGEMWYFIGFAGHITYQSKSSELVLLAFEN